MPEIIGIDPGLDGALAFIGLGEVLVIDMPTYEVKDKKSKKRHIDVSELLRILRESSGRPPMAYIERQQSYPNQGSVSNYSIGFGYATLVTALTACHIPFETVHPKAWQKHFGIKGATKGQACEIAGRLFPGVSIRGPRGRALDGRADALLIAEYGRRYRGVTI